MAYTLDVNLALGAGNTGLTLEMQLKDTAGSNVGSAVTSGFVEFGSTGNYLFHYAAWPDSHRGAAVFQVSPGGAVKAAVSINPQEVEFTDVKTSTRSSHTAADVWAAGTRTLTSFGTLVADTTTAVWAAGTRTLTSFGTLVADTAAAVWAYGSRTLTQLITAVTPPPVITGDTITIHRGDTTTLNITGLGNITGRSKLWFTVKARDSDADTAAIIEIEETLGLVWLNGAAGTAIQGSLLVTNATTGAVTITLAAAATAALIANQNYRYDMQSLTGTTVLTLTQGTFTVQTDVTRAVS